MVTFTASCRFGKYQMDTNIGLLGQFYSIYSPILYNATNWIADRKMGGGSGEKVSFLGVALICDLQWNVHNLLFLLLGA